MTSVNSIQFSSGDVIPTSTDAGLTSFLPEPSSAVTAIFQKLLGTGASVASGSTLGLDPAYSALISQQIQVQQQMQLVSFQSNIEKSKHETEMAVVRNMRVG